MPLPVSSKCWLVAISIFNDLITNQLLNDLLNELSEAVRRMLTVQMFDKFSDDFSVGFRFELVPLVFQKFLDVLVIGNNSCKWKSWNDPAEEVRIFYWFYWIERKDVPLWTTMNSLFSSERCGWEFTALGTPWVAQRVWAIPTWTSWIPSTFNSASPGSKTGSVLE